MLKKSKYKNLIIKEKKEIPIHMSPFLKGDGIDLIAVREELGNCVIYPIDVKTLNHNSRRKARGYNTYTLTPVQKEMNVRLLYYYPISGKFMFQDEEGKLLPKQRGGVDRYAFDVKE